MNQLAPTANHAAYKVKTFVSDELKKFFGSDAEISYFARATPFLERFENNSGKSGLIASWNFSILASRFFADDFSAYQQRVRESHCIDLSDPAIYPHEEQIEISLILSARIEKE